MKKQIDTILREMWDDVVLDKKMPYYLQVKTVSYVRRLQEVLESKKKKPAIDKKNKK